MTAPLRTLCLDIEGGHGGSSRSLFYSLESMDPDLVTPTVWCRREGPIQGRYEALGIAVRVEPTLPKASALPKSSRNFWQLGQHAVNFRRASNAGALDRLAEAARAHDVVHFNHEGFAGLARWLRHKTGRPASMHIRTNVASSPFARLQMRTISQAVDRVVFITPNEKRTFRSLGGTAPGEVIYNVARLAQDVTPHPAVPQDDRLIIASLSNAAYIRGIDRLLDVAAALRDLGRTDILIVCAGDMQLQGNDWPRELRALASRGGTLADAAAERGLAAQFLFLGHVPDPERVLMASHLLIKPTRESNPWGRDILEALAAGRPVLSVGTDNTFVEDGVTGVLQADFDASGMTAAIIALADDRARLATLGRAACTRVAHLCNGPDRARDLASVWHAVAQRPMPARTTAKA